MLLVISTSIAQHKIQVTGVTMTSDSLEVIPFIPIKVNTNELELRSNYDGVFSFLCNRGDKITFGGEGFEEQTFVVPTTLKGAHYSLVLFLNHDTFYLPTVIFRQEVPTGRDFDYAFRYWDTEEDLLIVGRRNATTSDMDYMMYALPMSGAESQSNYINQMHLQGTRQNMTPSVNLLKVPSLINSWRKGELRRKMAPQPTK